jgi:hypothetical protein
MRFVDDSVGAAAAIQGYPYSRRRLCAVVKMDGDKFVRRNGNGPRAVKMENQAKEVRICPSGRDVGPLCPRIDLRTLPGRSPFAGITHTERRVRSPG